MKSAKKTLILRISPQGKTVSGEIKPFYGYYHVMVELKGQPYGMLSVNGYTDKSGTTHGTAHSSKN